MASRLVLRGQGRESLIRSVYVESESAHGGVSLTRVVRGGRITSYRVEWTRGRSQGFAVHTLTGGLHKFKDEAKAASFAAEKLAAVIAWVELQAEPSACLTCGAEANGERCTECAEAGVVFDDSPMTATERAVIARLKLTPEVRAALVAMGEDPETIVSYLASDLAGMRQKGLDRIESARGRIFRERLRAGFEVAS